MKNKSWTEIMGWIFTAGLPNRTRVTSGVLWYIPGSLNPEKKNINRRQIHRNVLAHTALTTRSSTNWPKGHP